MTVESSPLSEGGDQPAGVRRVLWITLALNVAVAGSKIAYGTASGALAIRADGFHSLTDSANNVVGLVAIALSNRPADPGHPYGHHKIEVLASAFVGLSLLGMALDVVVSAVDRLSGHAVLPDVNAWGFAILGATLAVNLAVARYEQRRGEALMSSFLLTDAAHTRSDVLVTLGVLVAVALVRLGWPAFDVVAAIAVATFIARAGVAVLRKNLGYLTDAVAIDAERVRDVVLRVPGVASAHKIRSRGIPGAVHVDLHIQIAPHLDVVRAHRVTHWVIDAVKSELRGVQDVLVHTEPARPEQPFLPLPDEDPPAALPPV